MLMQFEEYLTFENIYLWINLGVLPFWLMLLFVPNWKIAQFFVNSIVLPLILGAAYAYVVYQGILMDASIFDTFKLYLGLDELYTFFSTESFLLAFWIHFVALNLFLGSWVSRDGVKYNISKKLIFLPLILIYLCGPLGLVLYWFFRTFYAKRLSFHD